MSTKAKQRSVDIDMTDGNIARHLIKFSIPLLIGNLFQIMYNMVDTWVVGRYVSDAAFSAVGNLGSTTNLMIGFFIGLSSGAGVVISRFFGAKNYEKVKDTVSTALILTAALCVLFTVLGLLLIPAFMRLLNMPAEVHDEAVTYLSIWFAGISGLMIYNIGSAIMRAVGDSRRPFIFLVISAVINTVLDLVFVRAFGWGVAGVAVATIIAQGASALLAVVSLCRTESCVKISFKHIKFRFAILKEIFLIGLPAALQMTITSFSNMFVQRYINFFGTEVMGGWTAYNKIGQVVLLPMQSFALASTTFVGQNIGKNYVKRAEKGANTALLMSIASTAILIIPIISFSPAFVNIFNENELVINYGATFIRMLLPFYLIWCVNQIYSGALRGVGKSTGPMIIMLSSFVAFRQAYLFVVSKYISNTIYPIAMAFPAGWVLAALITITYYKITGLAPRGMKGNDESHVTESAA